MEYGGCSTIGDFYTNGKDKLKAAPTRYAVAQGAAQSSRFMLDDTGCCLWWLRSPTTRSDVASYVSYSGSINVNPVSSQDRAIHPAFRIDLSSAGIK